MDLTEYVDLVMRIILIWAEEGRRIYFEPFDQVESNEVKHALQSL